MLSQSVKLGLMFDVMENSMLRRHTYMQILLASKQLVDAGANLSWFNFDKFVNYSSPIDQLTIFEKEMLFRNFYSYERVALFIDTWYKRHEHLIKAFRSEKGWNESEFYFNLNETVDTPISMLNAYRDFMLLTYSYWHDKPKFRDGLPIDFNAQDIDIAHMFLDVYEQTINEGLITRQSSRLSESKFSKMSPLFISSPVQLTIKDIISNAVNTGRCCDIATKAQSDDPFKSVFGVEFHNFLPDLYSKIMNNLKKNLTSICQNGGLGEEPTRHYSILNEALYTELVSPILTLIKQNKSLFIAYLLKYLNAGNKNVTKQSILNKLASFVHVFNFLSSPSSFVSAFAHRYRSRNIYNQFYMVDKGESDDVAFNYYPATYQRPEFFPADPTSGKRSNNYMDGNIRLFYLLDNFDYNAFVKWSMTSLHYTSVTLSKVRHNGRFSVRNIKSWNNFITDLNEYLNFRSDTKNFLINLHPCALINASLGYGGWSSCHSHIDSPTLEMKKHGSNGSRFPMPGHSYWMGNYQLAQGNAFVITEPPFLVKEKQWLVPNKVRTIAWVAENYSSIRMNLPYPTKQSGDIPDEMYLEYTAIRERMASIFKPFVSVPEPHTWVRVSSNGMNSKDKVIIKHNGDEFYSDILVYDPSGSDRSSVYDGYSGEYLQSASILKELVSSLPDKTSYLIHSADFLTLNNEKLVLGTHDESLSETNAYDYQYSNPSHSSRTFISKFSRTFSNLSDVVFDFVNGTSFNKKFMLMFEGGDYISYSTYLINKHKFFYCHDTKLFSLDAKKVYVDKAKNFVYFSKSFLGAKLCSVSNEYFLPSLMVDDVSVFELMKRSQVEWSFVVDDFVKRNLVFVYDDLDALNNFLDTLSKKTSYRWASGKLPNEYHFDTSKAIVFADGVLKLKSVDDLDGFKIVDVKNLLFKS